MAAGIDFDRIAFYEKERKGIFILGEGSSKSK